MAIVNGVYAGSFDPPTNGHIDIVTRASKLVDMLYVVVGVSADKKPWFSAEERVAMLREALANLPNVKVESHSGLTVDFALKNNAQVLIRGLRSGVDYDYEATMAQMNRQLSNSCDTIFIPAKSDYFHISSSLVKELSKHGADVSRLVPASVQRKISDI